VCLCINGMIMEVAAFLTTNRRPSEADIKKALAGNLCRCGTHARIVRAVKRAARRSLVRRQCRVALDDVDAGERHVELVGGPSRLLGESKESGGACGAARDRGGLGRQAAATLKVDALPPIGDPPRRSRSAGSRHHRIVAEIVAYIV
jgi:[2Fe-2S] binding domain